MNVTRENQVFVVGQLEKLDIEKKINDKNEPYLRGNLVVKVLSPKEMSIPLTFYCAQKTKTGQPRKLYGQLESLRQGQRVSITGQIGANMFWDATRNQLVKTKRLSISFINDVKTNDEDRADFVFSGFVKEPLKELVNSDQVVTGYAIKLAQASYQGDKSETITFNVDPKDTKAINYMIQEYTVNKTIKVTGILDFDVKTIIETKEAAFGPDIVTTTQRNISNLMIRSGLSVDAMVYEFEDIKTLNDGEVAEEKRIERDAKASETSGASANTNKPLASNSGISQKLML